MWWVLIGWPRLRVGRTLLMIDDTPSLGRSSSPYVVADGSSQHFSFQRWSPHSAGFGLCVVGSKGKARARSTTGRHDGIVDGRRSASLRNALLLQLLRYATGITGLASTGGLARGASSNEIL